MTAKDSKKGTRTEVRTKDNKIYQGILMERNGLSGDKHLVIKLDSGYNLGIRKDEISEIREIKSEKNEKKPEKQDNRKKWAGTGSKKPGVVIISAGGTISSKVDYKTGGVYAAFSAEDLLASHPELRDFADVRTTELMNVMSEDMHPGLWRKIAEKAIEEAKQKEVVGIVITHGTDTMGYTAAALSFMLQVIEKPVAITGSQRSSDRGSADSFMNLICSVIWAANSGEPGVVAVMHGSMSDEFCYAHPGTRVRKMHTSRRDAFQSINSESLARIYPNGKIEKIEDKNATQKTKKKTNPPTTNLEGNVAFIKTHPGIDPKLLDFHVKSGVRGIVFEGTGLGHVPTTIKETSFLPGIEAAIKKGVIFAMTSQCINGRVHPYTYSNLRELSSRGVVFCEDMLPETAYVKMMWALGQTKDPKKAAEMMLTNYAGEISERSRPDLDIKQQEEE